MDTAIVEATGDGATILSGNKANAMGEEVGLAQEIDKTKSLQQLGDHDWDEPTFESHLVQTCHKLRRKPLEDFTVEDLRIMIGQAIGLPYLVPIALAETGCQAVRRGRLLSGRSTSSGPPA